jgi:uncharacterized membrane protein YqaE (UPF0057 family)
MRNNRPAAKCRPDQEFYEPSGVSAHRPVPVSFGPGRFFCLWNLQQAQRVFLVTPSGETRMDFIRIIIAIILPPLGVFLQVGFGGAFWLNILLTLLGYIPGIVHAVYIIAKR